MQNKQSGNIGKTLDKTRTFARFFSSPGRMILALGLLLALPALAEPPAPVARTGQTTSYRDGDDGYHQAGVAWPDPRFTNHGDGTVTDNLTGLMWTQNANLDGLKTWNDSVDYCNDLDHAGHDDWRLPNINELKSLLDHERTNPSLPSGHPFSNIQNTETWRPYSSSTKNSWGPPASVSMLLSNIAGYDWDMHVWPVRGQTAGPAPVPKTGRTDSDRDGDDGYHQAGVESPDPRFTDHGDGTVTDNLTGLMWTQDAAHGGSRTWDDAVDYCHNLTYAGRGDWRLPNINEMMSLVCWQTHNKNPAGNPFSNSHLVHWTSTTYANNADSALTVGSSMTLPPGAGLSKTQERSVWPVRTPGIYPITITAQPDSKPYDGTVDSSVDPLLTEGELEPGHSAIYSQVFATPGIGTGKTLIPSVTILDEDTADVTHLYEITRVNDDTGEITERPITVIAQSDSKLYDGTVYSDVDPLLTGTLLAGHIGIYTQVFDTAEAGSGKTLIPSATILDGDEEDVSANYEITLVYDYTGEIAHRPITVTAQSHRKVYDGTVASAVNPLLTGPVTLAAGHSGLYTQVFATPDVGTGKTLIPSATILDGEQEDVSANYEITLVNNESGEIRAEAIAAITVTAQSDSKVYDGTVASAVVPQLTAGALPQGHFAIYTQEFATRDAGTGKTLIPSVVIYDGQGEVTHLYDITLENDQTGEITRRTLTLGNFTADFKVRDGTTDATGTFDDNRLEGDDLEFTYIANFEDAEAGAVKTVYVTDIVISGGADQGNYYLATTELEATAGISVIVIDATGSTQVEVPELAGGMAALLVAGGGGGAGGRTNWHGGGGGGAGGVKFVVLEPGTDFSPGDTIDVTVGLGGARGANNSNGNRGDDTELSIAGSTVALTRGGGGGGRPGSHALSGGSGGGASCRRSSGNPGAKVGDGIGNPGNAGEANYMGGGGGGAGQYAGSLSRGWHGITLAELADQTDFDPVAHAFMADVPGLDQFAAGGGAGGHGSRAGGDGGGGGGRASGNHGGDATNWGGGGGGAYHNGTGGHGYQGLVVLYIAPPMLTVTAQSDLKLYDGTVDSTAVPELTAGTLGYGHTAIYTQVFATADAGTGKALIPSVTILDGEGADVTIGYDITLVEASGTIAHRPITVTAQHDLKFYDGTVSSDKISHLTGGTLVDGHSGTYTQEFDTPGAGPNKTLVPLATILDGEGDDVTANYEINPVNDETGLIYPRGITVTAQSDSKFYDGTVYPTSSVVPLLTAGTLAAGHSGIYTQVFDTPDAGTGKTLLPSATILDGEEEDVSANYNITLVNDDTGEIMAQAYAALTVTAQADTKEYDGTVDSSVVPLLTSGSLAGGHSGTYTQVFDTPDFGTGKTLTPSVTIVDGEKDVTHLYDITLENYYNGVIDQRPITVTAQHDTKENDGTVASSVVPLLTDGSLAAGHIGIYTQEFDTAEVGTGKTLTPSATIRDGAEEDVSANYDITLVEDETGVIVKPVLTVTAQQQIRVYDGTAESDLDPQVDGALIAGHEVLHGQDFLDKHVGEGKTLVPFAAVVEIGTSVEVSDDYEINLVTNFTGVITNRLLNLSNFTADDKDHDWTTNVTGTGFDDDRVEGDDLEFTYTASFADFFPGWDKTVNYTGIEISGGDDQDNYLLVTTAGQTSAHVRPFNHPVTITAQHDLRIYDSTTNSVVKPQITSGQLFGQGQPGGDVADLVQYFDTKHVGANKELVPQLIDIVSGRPRTYPLTVLPTGQTTAYRDGDDGYHQAGAGTPDPRFTDNLDGTVTDNLTGLMWLQDAGMGGNRDWAGAIDYGTNLVHAGYDDWRLPNALEMYSLIDLENFSPALPSGHPFVNAHLVQYWTSTSEREPGDDNAYYVHPADGTLGRRAKTDSRRVWPVRGQSASLRRTGQTTSHRDGDDGYHQAGVEWPSPRFTNHGDGTVTDHLTGLMWARDPGSFHSMDWNERIDTINGLALGHYDDWRMANWNEIHSLVCFGSNTDGHALPAGHPFNDQQRVVTSTTTQSNPNRAWQIVFDLGTTAVHGKDQAWSFIYGWPVRTLDQRVTHYYDITLESDYTGVITNRILSLGNFIADNKQYDGTTQATGSFSDDRITGDDLEFSSNINFEDAEPGEDKAVYFTNIAIAGGEDMGNYLLPLGGTWGESTATIRGMAENSMVYDLPGSWFPVEIPSDIRQIAVLLIGGGGSGAAGRQFSWTPGGGGGAGEVQFAVLEAGADFSPGDEFVVNVGAGGQGVWARPLPVGSRGSRPGEATRFSLVGGSSITALGGGGGGGWYGLSGDPPWGHGADDGGSGGGSGDRPDHSDTPTPAGSAVGSGLGHDGGSSSNAGGGGGAGAPGGNRDGGDGISLAELAQLTEYHPDFYPGFDTVVSGYFAGGGGTHNGTGGLGGGGTGTHRPGLWAVGNPGTAWGAGGAGLQRGGGNEANRGGDGHQGLAVVVLYSVRGTLIMVSD